MRHPGQPLEEKVDGLTVHRIPMGWLFERNSWVLSQGDSAYKKAIILAERLQMRMRQVSHIADYPYTDLKAVRLFARAAEELYQSIGFDLVAAEHYGLETLHAGLTLKENHPEIKYVQFFWDSMSGGFRPKYLPGSYIDKRRFALEKYVFETADVSVAMTSHKEKLLGTAHGRDSYEAGRLQFLGIPYLYDVAAGVNCDNPLPFETDKLNMVFAGNLWGRDPEPLVRALSSLGREDVVLWLVSGTDCGSLANRLAGLDVNVRFHSYLDHDSLIAALVSADVLVNFGVRNPSAISGKVIEYIGCCKPILSTYSIDNEACLPVLQNYPAKLLLDERQACDPVVVSELGDFLDSAKSQCIEYGSVSRKYYWCLPETYCELIDSLLEEKARG